MSSSSPTSTIHSTIFIIHTALDNSSKQYILPVAEPIEVTCQKLSNISPSHNTDKQHLLDNNIQQYNGSTHNDELCLHSVNKCDILDTLRAFGYCYNHATLHIDLSNNIKLPHTTSSNRYTSGLWLRVPSSEFTLPVTQLYHPALGHGYSVSVAMELDNSQSLINNSVTTPILQPITKSEPIININQYNSNNQNNSNANNINSNNLTHKNSTQSNTQNNIIKNSTINSSVTNNINSIISTSPESSATNDNGSGSGNISAAINNSANSTPQPNSTGKRRKQRKKLKPAKSIGEMLDRMAQFEQARQQLKSKNKACRSLGYSKGTITSYARRIQVAFSRGIDLQQLRQTKYRQLKKVLDQYASIGDVQTDIKWESDNDDSDIDDGDDTDVDDDDNELMNESPATNNSNNNSNNNNKTDPTDQHTTNSNHSIPVPNYSTDKESAVNMLADTASMLDSNQSNKPSNNNKKSKSDKTDQSLNKSSIEPIIPELSTTPLSNSMPPPSSSAPINTRTPLSHINTLLPPPMDPVATQMSLQPQPFTTAPIYTALSSPNHRFYNHQPQSFNGVQQYHTQFASPMLSQLHHNNVNLNVNTQQYTNNHVYRSSF